MLARHYRLVAERDFQELYRRGNRLTGRYILLRTISNQTNDVKIAVVMSTKVAKDAVVRNQHKRRVREVIRQLIGQLPLGWNSIVTITRPVKTRDEWPAFREDIRTAFVRRFSL